MLSFFKVVNGGADESSFVAFLDQYFIGKLFILVILAGSLSFIFWRLYESVKDPYAYGNAWKGLILRIGIALSSLADVFIAYSIIKILLGKGHIQQNGVPVEEREFVASLLALSYGHVLVISIGVILMITALVQLFYGVTKGYKERIDKEKFNKFIRQLIFPLACSGFISRGIIIGIIGIFFIKSGLLQEEQYIVNTDKAFDFVGDEIGHIYFILLAFGTICYGLFTFTLGLAYDSDKDK